MFKQVAEHVITVINTYYIRLKQLYMICRSNRYFTTFIEKGDSFLTFNLETFFEKNFR